MPGGDARAGARRAPAHVPRQGRSSVPRGQVEEIQRARLMAAMIDVAAESGLPRASVGRVVARAGVSRRTFYELFDGRDACFLAAFDWGVKRAGDPASEAHAGRGGWRDRTRITLATLLVFLDCEPALARTLLIEALAGSEAVLERRAWVLARLAAALRTGAPSTRAVEGGAMLTAEGIVGGVVSVLHTHLLGQRALEGGSRSRRGVEEHVSSAAPELAPLLGELMALIVLPYLGAKAAAEELRMPAPAISRSWSEHELGEPMLGKLQMRLTYRTMRCLLYIAEHPGASNRDVAVGAEIADDGQTSKLLMRLAGLELLSKGSGGPGRPNTWELTPRGEAVLRAMSAR